MVKPILAGSVIGFLIGLGITLAVDHLTNTPLDVVLVLNILAPMFLAMIFAAYFTVRWGKW